MSFPSPARDWWEIPLSLDDLCDIKNPAVFMYRYESEDQRFVKKGAVLVVDRSLQPRAGDLLVAVIDGEMVVLGYKGLNKKELPPNADVTIEGVVTCVFNKMR